MEKHVTGNNINNTLKDSCWKHNKLELFEVIDKHTDNCHQVPRICLDLQNKLVMKSEESNLIGGHR